MDDKKKLILHKAALIGKGLVVFAILFAVVAGLFWGGYHRYSNVVEWAGEESDPMRCVRMVENDRLYIRAKVEDESTGDEGDTPQIIRYTVDEVLGEVKPVFPRDWNVNYVVEHIKDQDDLIYIIIDGEQVLYYAEDTDNPLLKDLMGE